MIKKLTIKQIESKVAELNKWLRNNPNHFNRKEKECNRNFYVSKLQYMDEYDLPTIEI